MKEGSPLIVLCSKACYSPNPIVAVKAIWARIAFIYEEILSKRILVSHIAPVYTALVRSEGYSKAAVLTQCVVQSHIKTQDSIYRRLFTIGYSQSTIQEI
ncbi:hypothetical protein TSAR_013715 [Trichomalopsis sarcophagae]|uniref:Uncharacterized protein n=1 Tax=Trichomalopsis sarcophagae TaxID=543379 RepID=A0A232FB46_9HYME|nr:hypothetical protein TSAR_013715 [Trichomalopsis sarcophagae]